MLVTLATACAKLELLKAKLKDTYMLTEVHMKHTEVAGLSSKSGEFDAMKSLASIAVLQFKVANLSHTINVAMATTSVADPINCALDEAMTKLELLDRELKLLDAMRRTPGRELVSLHRPGTESDFCVIADFDPDEMEKQYWITYTAKQELNCAIEYCKNTTMISIDVDINI